MSIKEIQKLKKKLDKKTAGIESQYREMTFEVTLISIVSEDSATEFIVEAISKESVKWTSPLFNNIVVEPSKNIKGAGR